MIGLTILAAFAVYLIICIFVVRGAIRWARRRGRSGWRWGIAAGLFMYLLVFWDHIPTLVLHKYYCNTKAGFWVYKTPEQWKAENPGVAETLTWRKISAQYNKTDGSFGFRLNARFVDETSQVNTFMLPVTISTDSIIDVGTNEILVRRVKIGSGYNKGSFYKFWVGSASCMPGQREYGRMSQEFKFIGRGEDD